MYVHKEDEIVVFADDMANVPNITPIFVTVDPDRDDINAVKQYVQGTVH